VSGGNGTPRNPFGAPDVPAVDGPDVAAFAATVPAAAADDDENAPLWTGARPPRTAGALDGAWASRWRGGARSVWTTGTAIVQVAGDTLFVLIRDPAGAYLIEARQDGDRWLGRYANLAMAGDSTPWVGLAASDGRIDGFWAHGRWDLRRRATGEDAGKDVAAQIAACVATLPPDLAREVLDFAEFIRARRGR
jgi:hypothetical protein